MSPKSERKSQFLNPRCFPHPRSSYDSQGLPPTEAVSKEFIPPCSLLQ